MIKTNPKLFPNRAMVLGFIILSICLILFFRMLKSIADDNPSNWSPFFSFYRSSNCVEIHGIFGVCYLAGLRADHSSTDNKQSTADIINSFNLFTESTPSGTERENLDTNEWNCRFTSTPTHQQVDMQLYYPKKGDTFECWPNTPLDPNTNLGSTNF